MSQESSASRQPHGGSALAFQEPDSDTPENRDIVRVIHERSEAAGMPLDLDAVIRELGFDPADFVLRD